MGYRSGTALSVWIGLQSAEMDFRARSPIQSIAQYLYGLTSTMGHLYEVKVGTSILRTLSGIPIMFLTSQSKSSFSH